MRVNLPLAGLLALLLLPASLPGAPPTLTLPREVTGGPSEFLRVDAQTDGRQLRWFALDKGLSVFPSDLLRDGKMTVVIAARPGVYRLAAITCLADELSDIAVTTVRIGGEPDPGPTPPVPPDPTDPLAVRLRLLYDADADAAKASHAALLASFYAQAAKACRSPDVATAADLQGVLKRAAAGLIPESALVGLRQVVADELRRTLPVLPETPLTEAHRQAAASLFDRLAAILGGFKRVR